ncbi:hypothetical protein ADE_47550 [Achromobacter denitrificans]|nr:hypothetical protein ADE_47550 [Achromobacter denitrificans]
MGLAIPTKERTHEDSSPHLRAGPVGRIGFGHGTCAVRDPHLAVEHPERQHRRPPNQPVPPGQQAPAPNATPNTPTNPPNLDKRDQTRSDKHMNGKSGKHREANDNVPATPGSGAMPPPGYPNTGGK